MWQTWLWPLTSGLRLFIKANENSAAHFNKKLPPMNVLIVDHKPAQHRALEHRLNAMGVQDVVHAGNATQALQLLEDTNCPFDLIIADLAMGSMDGIGLMRALASCPCRAPLAVVGNLDTSVERAIHSLATALDYPLAGFIGNPLHNTGLGHIFENIAAPRKHLECAHNAVARPAEYTLESILNGLELGQLQVVFQPIVASRSLLLSSIEALPVWNHPQHVLVQASDFVPVLERAGEAHRLTEMVVRKTVQALRRLGDHGIETRANINLSLADLQHNDLLATVKSVATQCRIPARRIGFEITETSGIREQSTTLEMLSRLRLQGFGLSLDHFGSGHSSLQSLDRLPVNEIKIDASYVADINNNSLHRKLVKSMIDLGRHVGATVVATGVENDQQCQYLTQLGCPLLQGNFIDEPMSTERLILSYGSIASEISKAG